MTPVGSIGLFPGKLHNLLDYAEQNDLQDVICWIDNGTAFVVKDSKKLEEILPKFFRVTKYKSFQRQLNMWNFERNTHNGDRNARISHPYFVRGNKSLCSKMARQNEQQPPHPSETEASKAALAGVISMSQLYSNQYERDNTAMISNSGGGNVPPLSSAGAASVSVAIMGSSSTPASSVNHGAGGNAHSAPLHLNESALYSPSQAKKQRSEVYTNNNNTPMQHAVERLPENSMLSTCFGINGRSNASGNTPMNGTVQQQEQQQQQRQQQQQLQLQQRRDQRNNGSPIESGDVVEFEGKKFHYLDGNERN